MYRERRAIGLPATVWIARSDRPDRAIHAGPGGQAGEAHRVLPDGGIDIIWSSDGRLIVAGPDTAATVVPWASGVHHVGVRFDPGHGPARLGTPAAALRDSRIDLAALWGDGPARRLADQVAAAGPQTAARALAIQTALLERQPDTRLSDPMTPAIVSAVRARVTVGALARSVGLSERQLLRRSRRVFGYGPKTLGRVLRLQEALRTARSGHGLALTAALSGYADQAHLAHEVRALTGLTATDLLASARVTPTVDAPSSVDAPTVDAPPPR
ncbi:helix-turn-helix domain-containing protein [Frankia sp. AgPm24]|uniref:helix-turn-helix domain-containing protein n=1 Tax=Frankia sp. AgPm24 TaxID=631128 RepID=UPI00200DB4B1|nr:helix-turn-helix domain-containing protein [Frankia sp. AgPm24]MCK9920497.1 helix-turn-helix domain-containing protein [Frankia sp. AgPm24]